MVPPPQIGPVPTKQHNHANPVIAFEFAGIRQSNWRLMEGVQVTDSIVSCE